MYIVVLTNLYYYTIVNPHGRHVITYGTWWKAEWHAACLNRVCGKK